MTNYISTPQEEGFFFASKWIHFHALISYEELKALFTIWGDFSLFLTGRGLKEEEITPTAAAFLDGYKDIWEGFKKGLLPGKESLKKLLPAYATLAKEAVYLQKIADNKFLTHLRRPVIQLQPHFFGYSPVDSQIRSAVLGKDSIFWGIQFSYPQLYQHTKTEEVLKSSTYLNEKLFLTLRKWIRDATLPTPFLLPDGKKVNVPFRIGKDAISWGAAHPQLKEQNLRVVYEC